jgi:hypothetical protein
VQCSRHYSDYTLNLDVAGEDSSPSSDGLSLSAIVLMNRTVIKNMVLHSAAAPLSHALTTSTWW